MPVNNTMAMVQFEVPALIHADISSFTHEGFSTNVNTMEKTSNILVLLWEFSHPVYPKKGLKEPQNSKAHILWTSASKGNVYSIRNLAWQYNDACSHSTVCTPARPAGVACGGAESSSVTHKDSLHPKPGCTLEPAGELENILMPVSTPEVVIGLGIRPGHWGIWAPRWF